MIQGEKEVCALLNFIVGEKISVSVLLRAQATGPLPWGAICHSLLELSGPSSPLRIVLLRAQATGYFTLIENFLGVKTHQFQI